MSKHTPEPWRVNKSGRLTEVATKDASIVIGWPGFDDARIELETRRANADRIVLCVNAMSGIASAEPGSVAKLVEAAIEVRRGWVAGDDVVRGQNMLSAALASIRVEGGE